MLQFFSHVLVSMMPCQTLLSFTIDAFKELQGLLYAVAFGDEAEAPWNTFEVVTERVLCFFGAVSWRMKIQYLNMKRLEDNT